MNFFADYNRLVKHAALCIIAQAALLSSAVVQAAAPEKSPGVKPIESLWLVRGQPPANPNVTDIEVVVSNFRFVPTQDGGQ